MSSKDTEESKEPKKTDSDEISKIEQKINDTKPESKDTSEKKISDNIKENKILNESSQKEKNKYLWKIIMLIIILAFLLIFSTIFAFLNIFKNTIAKGVKIDGIDVSNLTSEEATNKITEAINVKLLLGLQLIYGEDYSVDIDPSQIQFTYDIKRAINEAVSVGKNGNIIINNYTLIKTAFFGKNINPESNYNEDLLNQIIDDISSKVPGLVIQPSYYIENDKLIIDKGQTGIQVDKDKLKNDILENIKNRNAFEIIQNNTDNVINIQVEHVEPQPVDIEKIYNEIYSEPKDAYYIAEPFQLFSEENGVDFAISIEEAKNIVSQDSSEFEIPLKITPAGKTIDDIGTEAFPYLISSYTTKYDASNKNRSENLKISANKINGTVLMPGETFSYNEVVGKRTIEDGYTNAKIYENGQVVDGLAGGICQISSTLYNAVLLANLEIVERRNHSYTTSYVAAGRDATVVYGTQDFKFKNTRKYPIKLEANVSGGIAEFKIHGIKEEIEYEIKIIPVTTQTIPYTTEYVPDSTLVPGQQVIKQAGHSGCKVTTYLEKRVGGTVISKDVLSNDTYNAMKTIVNVGG